MWGENLCNGRLVVCFAECDCCDSEDGRVTFFFFLFIHSNGKRRKVFKVFKELKSGHKTVEKSPDQTFWKSGFKGDQWVCRPNFLWQLLGKLRKLCLLCFPTCCPRQATCPPKPSAFQFRNIPVTRGASCEPKSAKSAKANFCSCICHWTCFVVALHEVEIIWLIDWLKFTGLPHVFLCLKRVSRRFPRAVLRMDSSSTLAWTTWATFYWPGCFWTRWRILGNAVSSPAWSCAPPPIITPERLDQMGQIFGTSARTLQRSQSISDSLRFAGISRAIFHIAASAAAALPVCF